MDHRLKLIKYLIEGKKTKAAKEKKHVDSIIAASSIPDSGVAGEFKWLATGHNPSEGLPDVLIRPRGSQDPRDTIAIEAKVVEPRESRNTKPGETEKTNLHFGKIPVLGNEVKERMRQTGGTRLEPSELGIDEEEFRRLVTRQTHGMIIQRGDETHVVIPHSSEEDIHPRLKEWLTDTGLKVTHTIEDIARNSRITQANRSIMYGFRIKPKEEMCPDRLEKCHSNNEIMTKAHARRYPDGIGPKEKQTVKRKRSNRKSKKRK
jgi:hypothetical protein